MWKAAIVVITSVLIFQACSRQSQPEDSCNFVMNSELHRVSWNSEVPVTMYIDASTVPAEYVQAIRDAMAVWNTQLGRQVFANPIYASMADRRSTDGYSVIYFIKTNWFGTDDEQARTSMYYAGEQIYEADIRVNTEDFHYATGDVVSAASQEVDFRSLMIHELGHVLGLAHNDHEKSVMERTLEYGQIRNDRKLYDSDVKSAHCEY